MSNPGKRKVLSIAALLIFLCGAGVVAGNWDIVLRLAEYYRNGTLSLSQIRRDIASFDVGRQSRIVPVDTRMSPKDGMTQVYIPEGEFRMGIGTTHDSSNSPEHAVYLSAYWMDQVEVTNAMYLKCMQAGGCTPPASDNVRYDGWAYRNHPITYVTWYQAQEYCQWAERRLPTEAEWEKAARGTDAFKYPWGNQSPDPSLANYEGTGIHQAMSAYRYPLGASPYGVLNMSGNVREWVFDWHSPLYYTESDYTNPQGPETGMERVLRSGSYNEDAREIRAFSRFKHEPQSAGLSRGFRCAQDATR